MIMYDKSVGYRSTVYSTAPIGRTQDNGGHWLDMLPDAIKRVKTSLLVRELAKIENIKVEDEEIDKQIREIKEHHKKHHQDASTDSTGSLQASSAQVKEAEEKFSTPEYRSYVLNILSSQKVIDKLREWNIVK